MRVSRRGHTVVELLVSLSIGAIVLALAATVGFRHQRFHRDIAVVVERTEQLEQIASLLPVSLRAIAPGEGDIAPGAARDTSLGFRAVVASAVACDASSATVLAAPVGASPRLSSVVSRPQAGDTAWAIALEPSGERWHPLPIVEVFDSLATCALGGSRPFGDAPRPSLALRFAAAPAFAVTALRITRPWRYSLYRASDGGWHLGAREWNPVLSRFNAIQPIAGPLRSAVAGGLRFSYTDSSGQGLASGTVTTNAIVAIAITIRGDSVLPGRYAHAASMRSASAVVGLRNAP